MNLEHRADLPEPGLELCPIDRSKLHCLQVLEWFQINEKSKESTELLDRLFYLLKKLEPEKDLVNNIWIKRVMDTKDFRLLISTVKKDPAYSEYFKDVINKKEDGYLCSSAFPEDAKDDDVQVVADSLFLEEENVACRVLGIQSDFKCLDCHQTNCATVGPKIMSSTSPETLSKLFTLIMDGDPDNCLTVDSILVVGSGIGSIPFCARLFLPKARIISCEADPKLYNLQVEVVHRHGMSPMVSVLNQLHFGVANTMSVVILCERLLTSIGVSQRKEIILSLRRCMRAGRLLIFYRKIEDWLKDDRDDKTVGKKDAVLYGVYNEVNVDILPWPYFDDWLELEHVININIEDESAFYHVYRVIIDES